MSPKCAIPKTPKYISPLAAIIKNACSPFACATFGSTQTNSMLPIAKQRATFLANICHSNRACISRTALSLKCHIKIHAIPTAKLTHFNHKFNPKVGNTKREVQISETLKISP